MAFWNKKKESNKLEDFFKSNNINYQISDDNKQIKFELLFKKNNYILYPYLTLDENIISFNVNINKVNPKNYNLISLNNFNLKSKFFKVYLLDSGLIVLEYRFYDYDAINILNELIDSLYSLEEELDLL